MIDRYVGIPFVDGGRGAHALDCWGLYRFFVGAETDFWFPAFDISCLDYAAVGHEIRRQRHSPEWRRIAKGAEQRFDIVVLWSLLELRGVWKRQEIHVGAVWAPGRLLHTEPATGSVCVPFSHPSVRDRITRIYRHERFDSGHGAA